MVSIGLIAAFFTTVSFIPQALKTLKTRDTSGISLPMYIMFFMGVSLWIIYGLQIEDPSIVIGNSCVLMFIVPILYIKIKAVSTKKAVA
ncbi:SemiSWEET transporter [Photobacterium sp. BZF1]|uniref:SemiSWEET transporter n=1 Tax=Photobacterium TaxID=657 RepID=UPI001653BF90|nr:MULTISPECIES: SemiSWEET transporter [Photobacterium]MBC7004362.1 SemiSWEET transporter [Photobacterium sp. BZF1]MBY5944415.1 SemiSWEET transporter [Photobacterium rosenbergii]